MECAIFDSLKFGHSEKANNFFVAFFTDKLGRKYKISYLRILEYWTESKICPLEIGNLDRVHVDTIKELPPDWFSIGYFRWVFPLEEYLPMSKGLFSKRSKEICSYCVDVVSNIVAQKITSLNLLCQYGQS